MTDITMEQIEALAEMARRDDWHLTLVGSDIRVLCAAAKRAVEAEARNIHDLDAVVVGTTPITLEDALSVAQQYGSPLRTSTISEVAFYLLRRRIEALEAAISTTQAELARVREALEPFTQWGEYLVLETEGFADSDELEVHPEDEIAPCVLFRIKVGDFRRALAALHPAPTEGGNEQKQVCVNCDGTGWVCEVHPDFPWAGVSSRFDACNHGPGIPCPKCNKSPGAGVLKPRFTAEWMREKIDSDPDVETEAGSPPKERRGEDRRKFGSVPSALGWRGGRNRRHGPDRRHPKAAPTKGGENG